MISQTILSFPVESCYAVEKKSTVKGVIVKKQIVSFFVFALAVLSPHAVAEIMPQSADAFVDPDRFEYRAEVTFPGYTGENALIGFPVLVRLAETEGGFSYSQAAAGGADLRFASSDGTLLASEIDVWDEGGESLIWVRVPQLTSDTSVFLY